MISGSRDGWTSGAIPGRFGLSALAFLGFIAAERRQAWPMVDLAPFRRPTFVGSTVAMLGYAASAQVMMTFLPLHLQVGFDISPLLAGLAPPPFAVPMVLFPRLAGWLAQRYSGRTGLTLGSAIVCAGDLAAALLVPTLSYRAVCLGMLVMGAGAGLLNGETAKSRSAPCPPSAAVWPLP